MANLVNLQKIRVKPTLIERGTDFAIIKTGKSETQFKIDIDRLQDWLVTNGLNYWEPVPWEKEPMPADMLAAQDCTTIPKDDLLAYCDELQVDYDSIVVESLYACWPKDDYKRIEMFDISEVDMGYVVTSINNKIKDLQGLFTDSLFAGELHKKNGGFVITTMVMGTNRGKKKFDVVFYSKTKTVSMEFPESSVNPRFYH